MLRLILTLSVVLAIVACSRAAGVQVPPERYDHGPLPGGLRYLYVDAADVGSICQAHGDLAEASDILACYVFAEKLIILPTRASDPLIFLALKRHEEAHARGWAASHPK